jgi:predicted phage-related endonuclease
MKHHTLTQGSPEWHAHRANCFNASDAPAMLGVSSYKTRSQLLRELATGLKEEVGPAQQRRFDNGHRFEVLARSMGEALIGEELYPVTGSEAIEGLTRRLSASFDGLTMLEHIDWEHKTLNDRLRACMPPSHSIGNGADLPLEYRAQMEQQLLVSGASRALFTASKWSESGELIEARHAWYESDAALRAQLLAGWAQFEQDLAAWKPAEAAPPKPVARTPENLPALRVEVSGAVTASNLAEFKEHALACIRGVSRELATDQDFADAEATVKWCANVEDKLAAAKQAVLDQMHDVAAVQATLDEVMAEARKLRLALEKDVKAKKDELRTALVHRANLSLRQYVAELNSCVPHIETGPSEPVPLPAADFAGAIKGKRSMQGCEDAVQAELARAKGVANDTANTVSLNTMALKKLSAPASLFPDLRALLLKAPEDFAALAQSRIHQHRAEQELLAKQAAERAEQQLAAEKAAHLERIAKSEAERLRTATLAQVAAVTTGTALVTPKGEVLDALQLAKADEAPTLSISVIARRLGFAVSADLLESLGMTATRQGAAKLYRESDWPLICDALIQHIQDVREPLAVAA